MVLSNSSVVDNIVDVLNDVSSLRSVRNYMLRVSNSCKYRLSFSPHCSVCFVIYNTHNHHHHRVACYRPLSRGDNTFGSVRVCVRPFVCGALPFEPFDL